MKCFKLKKIGCMFLVAVLLVSSMSAAAPAMGTKAAEVSEYEASIDLSDVSQFTMPNFEEFKTILGFAGKSNNTVYNDTNYRFYYDATDKSLSMRPAAEIQANMGAATGTFTDGKSYSTDNLNNNRPMIVLKESKAEISDIKIVYSLPNSATDHWKHMGIITSYTDENNYTWHSMNGNFNNFYVTRKEENDIITETRTGDKLKKDEACSTDSSTNFSQTANLTMTMKYVDEGDTKYYLMTLTDGDGTPVQYRKASVEKPLTRIAIMGIMGFNSSQTKDLGFIKSVEYNTLCEHVYDSDCDVDCNVCHISRVPTHELTHVEETEATLHQPGTIEYWYCDDCSCYYSDSAGMNVVSQDDLTLYVQGLAFTEQVQYRTKAALSNNPKTISAWIKLDPTVDDRGGVILGNFEGSMIPGVSFEIHENGNPRFYYVNSSGYYLDIIFEGDVRSDGWVHLAYVVHDDNRTVSCHVNGVECAPSQTKNEKNISVDWDSITNPYCLGGDLRVDNVQYFKGNISGIALYNEVLTQEEISKLYNGESTEAGFASYNLEKQKVGADIDNISSSEKVDDFLAYTRYFDTHEVNDYAYSFAVVGDTQIVTEKDRENNTTHLNGIYDWILENKQSKKIQYVFGLGDITDNNTEAEWNIAKTAIEKLNDNIPYSLVRGNHDMKGFNGASVDYFTTKLGTAEYKEQFADGDFYSEENTWNAWRTFTVGKVDYLLLSLDYGANDDVLAWAGEAISEHPEHNVIITTHAYLYRDGTTLDDKDECPPSADTTWYSGLNDGDDIWDELISQHDNIVLVMSGHDPCEDIVVTQTPGKNGTTVTQMLIDPQGVDADEGVTGMVAMLYFSEDGSQVQVEYYSTVRDQFFKRSNQFNMTIATVDSGSDETSWSVAAYTMSTDGKTGIGGVTGGASGIENNSEITLTATAHAGYAFKGWYKAVVEGEECIDYDDSVVLCDTLEYTLTVTEDGNYVAVYEPNGKVSLTVNGYGVTINGKAQLSSNVVTRYNAGSEITVTCTGDDFKYWKNGSGKIVSKDATYTFTLVNATELTLVTAGSGQDAAFVEFVSAYNQVLYANTWYSSDNASDYELPVGPSKVGYDFTGWSMDGSTTIDVAGIISAISSDAESHIVISPLYTESSAVENNVTVTVYNGAEQPDTVNKAQGSTHTVVATEVAGSTFSYWEDGKGTILSYNLTYTLLVSEDITVKAVYDQADVDVKPVVAITGVTPKAEGTTNKVTVVATRSIPSGYTFVQAGMLYDNAGLLNPEELEATLVLDASNVSKLVSTSTAAAGAYVAHIIDGDSNIYARAYIMVMNDATGHIETYYSSPVSTSYETLSNN